MKENDWIVATINNPDFTVADFKNILGLSLDNTLLLSKDDYLKSSFIVNNSIFLNEEGVFDKNKFNEFYSTQAKKFSDFLLESALDNYTYGFWDTSRNNINTKIDSPKIGIDITLNPEHRSLGVIGQGVQGEREFSDMELAQLLKIFDFTNKKELDYSADEASLFKNPIRWFKELLVGEPLVLATYDKDEDSINPITGQLEHHKKGEKKLNNAGEYYLETLGGRSILGKNVLSIGDIITSDTSSINKYDFFDSDGLEKDAAGVITKNLISIAPMLFLGPVGTTLYSGFYVARELSKTLPMLYLMYDSFTGNETDTKLINSIAAFGTKLSGSTSEYAKQNTFSFENFGNLISDVALLWGQQKFIANAVSNLRNSSNEIINIAKGKAMYDYEKLALNIINRAERGELLLVLNYTGQLTREGIANSLKNNTWQNSIIGQAALNKYLPEAEKAYAKRLRMGQDLSLVYMALISNTDVYDSAIEHGATKKEAAIMALGSTVGMFGVDKYLGLGEMFFDDPDAVSRRTFKKALRIEADNLNSKINGLASITQRDTKKNYLDFFKKGVKAAQNTINKYQGDIKDRALGIVGKSIGEGLEEMSEELVSDFTKSLYELAGSFGYTSTKDVGAWENARDRYLMSLFGGAIGGGIFGGIELIKNPISTSDKNSQKELLYLVKEGKTRDILKQLDVLHNRGELGNTEISIDSEDGTFLSSSDKHKSLNDFVYDIMKSSIILMDSIINGNQLNISDDALFERMVLSDPKFIALKDVLLDKSYITSYYDKYQNIIENIYNNEKAIKDLEDSTPDPEKRKASEYLNQMLELLNKKEQLKQEADNFKNGKYSLEYVERMLFAMNPEISGTFLSMNFNLFVRNKYNKDASELSESELNTYKELWENYNKTQRKLDFEEAFKLYKDISKKINPILLDISLNSNVNSWQNILNSLQDSFPTNFLKSYRDIEDSELGDISGLTLEEILAKKEEIANQYNNENISNFIQLFADNNSIIDSSSYRRLMAILNLRRKDIVSQGITKGINFLNIDDNTKSKFFEILNKFNEDFSNVNDIKEESKLLSEEYIKNNTKYGNAIINWDPIEDKGYYTFTDLLDIINRNYSGKEISEDIIDDIFEGVLNDSFFLSDLINAHNLEIDPSLENAKLLSEITEKYENSENSYTGFGMNNALVVGRNKHEEIILKLLDLSVESINKSIDKVISNILNNSYYKALSDVKKKITFENNPTLKLIKAIASKLGDNFSNIEDTLQSIYEQYERLDNIEDYLLSEDLINALLLALLYIEIAKGFISASSLESNYFHILPFYKTINEFNREHRNIFDELSEDLPELDRDTANVSLLSLNEYDKEINLWIEKSKANSLNKIREFKEFDKKFSEIKLLFLKDNFTKEGFGEDLIEGVESINLESPEALFELAKLLHYNFKSKGKTAEDLIPIFKRVIKGYGSKEFIFLRTSNLNGNITPDKFSAYDKFTYLTAIFAEDPIDFYSYYKDFIETKSVNNEGKPLAPLSFLEHSIKLAHAQETNPNLVNNILRAVSKDLKLKVETLYNTTIVTGLGGAGKTLVVARALTTSNNIWFSGPSNTQINNLLSLNNNSIGKSKQELFNEILEPGEYESILSEINSNKSGNKINILKSQVGSYVILKNINYKKLDLYPDKLIIDEATLFSSAELHILSQWAYKNNISLLLIGDENLNGNNLSGLNLAPEFLFAFRTPRLSISLRQGNYWKYVNLKPLELMMDSLRGADSTEQVELVGKLLLENDFKNFLLHSYYQDNTLTGDLIVKEFDNKYIKSLKGTIGYVGETNTLTYLKLKNLGVTVLNPLEVLGLEFDYVIIDKDWKFNNDSPVELFHYMLDLYTMITRSKKGSIIIDNYLSNIIKGNKEENYTTDAITLNPLSVEEFTKSKLQFLNSLDLNKREIEIQENNLPKPLEFTTPVEVPSVPVEIEGQINLTEEEEEENESTPSIIEPISDFPYTIYGNVGFTGLTFKEEDGKEIWESNGLLRDLDILLSEEALKYLPENLRKNKLTTSEDLIAFTLNLIKLKSFITFGGEYRRLPNIIKNLFTEEDINNIEYFIVSEDEDSNIHHTLRKQLNLNDDKVSFIKNASGINLVLSLLGRITKNGKTYSITLGLLESLEGSKKSKNILLNLLEREMPKLSELERNLEADKIINSYDTEIKNIVNQKERKISKPFFTKTTGLRKVNKRDYRIQNLNQLKGEMSRYEYATIGYVTSPIYTIIDEDEIKKLGLSTKLVGKPIMYVSANSNLNPLELSEIYARQKSDMNNNTPEVRCIVLDTEGVSFESMLRPAYTRNHYEIKVSDKKTFHLPFVSLPMAIRMYIALWNFRANLINFNTAVRNKFGNELALADEIAKLDFELYNQAKLANGNKYINSQEYKTWVKNTQSKETLDKLQRLWEFNDKLTELGIKQFRLGYSNQTGAYIRKINDNLNVTYINRDLAEKYELSIRNLFENIIDANEDGTKGLIPPISNNISLFIDKKATWKLWEDLEIDWVKDVLSGGSLLVSTSEGEVTHNFGASDRIRMLPTILKQININLLSRQYDILLYEQEMNSGKHQIKIGEDSLDYLSLINGIFDSIEIKEFGIILNKPLGTEAYNIKTGEGLIDKRLVTMFNLAFHGIPRTREFNDLTTPGLLKDSEALFPDGFYADTFISDDHTNGINKEVLTDKSFYSTNVVPSGPIIRFSFKENQSNLSVLLETSVNNSIIQNINNVLGTNYDEELDEETLNEALEIEFRRRIDSLFDGTKKDNILDTYVEYNNGKLITLKLKLELNYTNIEDFKKISTTQYEFVSNRKTYYFLKGSLLGEYEIKETLPQILMENELKASTLKQIGDYISTYLNIQGEDLDIFNDLFIGNDGEHVFNRQSLLRRTNKLITELDEDQINDIKNLINKLPDANNGSCMVPIK